MRELPNVTYSHLRHEITINGLRFSPEVLNKLAPASGEWTGPFWIRRAGDVAIINTIDPATTEAPAHV